MSPKKPAAEPRRRTSKKPRRRVLATRRLALPTGTKPLPWPFNQGLKIIKIQDGIPSQGAAHLHRHGVAFLPDRVQWINLDARGRTVAFKDGLWPFLEPPQDIRIRAHDSSRIFTVYTDAAQGGYGYAILPLEPQGPGEPQIVVDP
jgi:hypothetical protein